MTLGVGSPFGARFEGEAQTQSTQEPTRGIGDAFLDKCPSEVPKYLTMVRSNGCKAKWAADSESGECGINLPVVV